MDFCSWIVNIFINSELMSVCLYFEFNLISSVVKVKLLFDVYDKIIIGMCFAYIHVCLIEPIIGSMN